MALPVAEIAADKAHLYLWCPNALLPDGLAVMKAWGLQLQAQHRLAQGAQGRRLRWPRGRLLFPQRDRAASLRRARQERAHAGAGTVAGESAGDAQARAFTQARRAVRAHRGVQPRALSRTLRSWHPQRLGDVGRSGRHWLSPDVENVSASLCSRPDDCRGVALARCPPVFTLRSSPQGRG